MADKRTLTVLARRRRGKWLAAGAVGAALGLGLKIAFGTQMVGSFSDKFRPLWEVAPGTKLWLDAHPQIASWIAGPVMFSLLFLALAALPFARAVLARLWPDPPPFVRSSLEEARYHDRMLSLEGPSSPFVGRVNDLAELEALLETDVGAFAWRAVTGPSGIGKTRLAIEWLERAKAKGWDVGIVDPADYALVKDWSARRATALLIDEARRDWDGKLGEFLAVLARAGSPSRPLRVLTLDQVQLFVDVAGGENRDRVRTAQVEPPLRLSGLDDAAICKLREAVGNNRVDEAVLVRESAGRPRAALILLNSRDATSYADALSEWVERFVPEIGNPATGLPASLAGPLFLSALAGPVETDVARNLFGPIQAETLVRFYQREDRASLEQILPPISPDDLAQELLLRLLPRLDGKVREAAVDRMLAYAPSRVEARLGALWRDRPWLESEEAEPDLQWLQRRMDSACPDRVETVRKAEAETVDAIRSVPSLDRLHTLIEELGVRAAGRPFDPDIRLMEAEGLANAVDRLGSDQQFEEMELVAARLTKLVNSARFRDDAAFRLAEASAAVSAINHYGAASMFEPLERWGARLLLLAEDDRFVGDINFVREAAFGSALATEHYAAHAMLEAMESWAKRVDNLASAPQWAGDVDIRRSETMAVVNPLIRYSMDEDYKSLQACCRRLIGIVEDESFPRDGTIRLLWAKGCFWAVVGFGDARDFKTMEDWAKRLQALLTDGDALEESSCLAECVRGICMAMCRYSQAGRFDAVEQWGDWLANSIENGPLTGIPDVRLVQAEGMNDVIGHYGEHDQTGPMEAWGQRLVAIVDDERFRDDPDFHVHAAGVVMNVVPGYGRAGDFAAIERWATRLAGLTGLESLKAKPEIRLNLAKAINNILIAYDGAGRRDWPVASQWRERLADLAYNYPLDSEVQFIAKGWNVDAAAIRSIRGPAPFRVGR